MGRLQITHWCHERIRQMMPHPVHCLDATAGTGRDTLFLTEIADPEGTVTAMDIQAEAIRQTEDRLKKSCPDRLIVIKDAAKRQPDFVEKPVLPPAAAPTRGNLQDSTLHKGNIYLIQDGHEHMNRYLKEGFLDLILFNLGYLPGGDHSLATKPDTTVLALDHSLALLKSGGLLSVLIYSGGDSGFAEKEAVLEWARNLDPRRYLVILESFYNKPNHPPTPLFIIKE